MTRLSVARDNARLDIVARGGSVPGDKLAEMLAAWRDDVRSDEPGERSASPPIRHLRLATPEPAEPAEDDNLGKVVPLDRNRRRRLPPIAGLVIGVAASVVVAVGLVVSAAGAGPESPLWPITRLVYPERADQRAASEAEKLIDRADRAVTDNRFDDAERLLDRADKLIDGIRDPRVAIPLRDRATRVRDRLEESRHAPTSPSTGATTAPPAAPGTGTGPGGGLPDPGLPLPSLPLPTPSLPGPTLPVPTLPVPTLPVPTLPIPTLPIPTLPIPTLPILTPSLPLPPLPGGLG
jgi:hypothetical protein